jgi:hypothetical protein
VDNRLSHRLEVIGNTAACRARERTFARFSPACRMSSPARRTRSAREFRAASGYFVDSSTGWVNACGELVRLL